MSLGLVFAMLGAALAAGLAGVGSAIGVGMVGRSAAGVTAEDPDKFSKLLVCSFFPVRRASTACLSPLWYSLKSAFSTARV